jgi:hypothetical protein
MAQIYADTKSESANCKSIGLGSEPLTVLRSGFIQIESVKSVGNDTPATRLFPLFRAGIFRGWRGWSRIIRQPIRVYPRDPRENQVSQLPPLPPVKFIADSVAALPRSGLRVQLHFPG